MSSNHSPLGRRLLTVTEVADHLHESERQVRRRIKSGEIIAHRFGRQIRIAPADLELFLRQRRGL